MAESNTTRFGLRRWTAGSDTPNRSEFDSSFLSLANTAAGWLAPSTAAARPAAAAANERFLHYASDTGRMTYSDGTTWFDVPLPAEVTQAADDAVTAHVALSDPHAQYLKESAHTTAQHDALNIDAWTLRGEAPAAFENAGTTATHAAAGDPHPGYLLESAHTKAAHDALNIDAQTLVGLSPAQLRTRSTHTGTVAIATILSDHTKAVHDALNIDAATLSGSNKTYYRARANHTGTQTLSTITGHDKAAHDLLGINAATLEGSSKAYYRSRANHTGSQPLTTITGHTKAVHDALNIDAATLDGLDSTAFARLTGATFTGTVQAPLLTVASAGTTASAAFRFSNDLDTGIYRVGVNRLGLTAGNGLRLEAAAGQVVSYVNHRFASGSALAPGVAFTADVDTGMYLQTVGALGFVAGGTESLRVTAGLVTLPGGARILSSVGALGAPGYAFDGQASTGLFYNPDVDTAGTPGVSVSVGNSLVASFYKDGDRARISGNEHNEYISFDASDDTISLYANNVEALKVAASRVDLSVPLYTTSNIEMGGPGDINGVNIINATGTSDLLFRQSGSTKAYFDTSAAVWRQLVTTMFPNGTAAVPSIAFGSDVDTGIYRVGTNSMGFTAGGVERMRADAAGVIVYTGLRVPNGAVGSLSMKFSGDGDTGIYRVGSDIMGFASGGALKADIRSTGLLIYPDGSKTSPCIAFSEASGPTDTGFFHHGSLNRICATVDMSSSTNEYASTITTFGGFYPGRDGTKELGNSTFTWKHVFAVNGEIQSSDIRTKTDVADAELGLDFIKALRVISWRRKDPEASGRPHYGFSAQQVKQVMDDMGLDDFAGYIDPALGTPPDPKKWPEAYDGKGNLNTARLNKGLRYGEFLGPLVKAVQELAEEVETLRAQVAAA